VKSATGFTRLRQGFGVAGIALGRDLVQADGNPCAPGVSTGCQVDVLGTQLEEVIE
jgi:hypothetical protein